MEIAVFGLGLIGGSVAKAIKKYTPHTVLGADTSEQVMYKARLLDAIDGEITAERLGICDVVILATWPQTAVRLLEEHADSLKKGALVMDVCGVKRAVCEPLWQLAKEKGFTFVGGHPMAGVEYAGFDHATAALFQGASMILTPPAGTDIATLERLKQFWMQLGFGRVVLTTPEKHDAMIAYTSQLAHVVSSAYAQSPTAQEHFGFSAGSYKDMTRVARLNEQMWTELFLCNQELLLLELDGLIERLSAMRDALAKGDETALQALLRRGRECKEQADRKDYDA